MKLTWNTILCQTRMSGPVYGKHLYVCKDANHIDMTTDWTSVVWEKEWWLPLNWSMSVESIWACHGKPAHQFHVIDQNTIHPQYSWIERTIVQTSHDLGCWSYFILNLDCTRTTDWFAVGSLAEKTTTRRSMSVIQILNHDCVEASCIKTCWLMNECFTEFIFR